MGDSDNPYAKDPEKWGAALTEERAVRWVFDARAADEFDTRRLQEIPDDELVERTGLPLEVVRRARPLVAKWYGDA